MRKEIYLLFCLAVGAMDSITGVLLLSCPEFTLGLMMIAQELNQPVFLRFVGAFVFAVGAAYFYPLLYRKDEGVFYQKLITTFALTSFVRAVICLFVLSAVFSGELVVAWITVAIVDGSVSIWQLLQIKKLKRQSHE